MILKKTKQKSIHQVLHLNDDVAEKHRSTFDITWESETDGKSKENYASSSLVDKFHGTGQPNTVFIVISGRNWIWIGGLD